MVDDSIYIPAFNNKHTLVELVYMKCYFHWPEECTNDSFFTDQLSISSFNVYTKTRDLSET